MSFFQKIETLRDKLSKRIGQKSLFLLFALVLFYMFFFPVLKEEINIQFFIFIAICLASIFFFFLQSMVKYYFPFIGFAGLLMFFSFFGQSFELGVEYSLTYFVSFSVFIGSLLNAGFNEKYKVFWIGLFIFFLSAAPSLILNIPIGDEPQHIETMAKFETGKFKTADFGSTNYINVSFVYFYYLIITAKILGTSIADIFFVSKLFFSMLLFFSLVLIFTQFSNKRIGTIAAFVAFFPIMTLHLAPQMIGKYAILSLFLYLYLKYFRAYRTRILLILLILLLVYINLTTMYISLAVFAVFVWAMFLLKTIKKRTYLIDLFTLFLFVVLVLTYFHSVDLTGIYASTFTQAQPEVIKEAEKIDLPQEQKKSPNEEKIEKSTPTILEKKSVSEAEKKKQHFLAPILYLIPSERIQDFFFNYTSSFGWYSLYSKAYYYLLIILLLIVLFIKKPFPDYNIHIYSFAVFLLALGLLAVRFADGVHATLAMLEITFFTSMVALFLDKKNLLIILLIGFLAFHAAVQPYSRNFFENSTYYFNSYFHSEKVFGENAIIVPDKYDYQTELIAGSNYLVSCFVGNPREIRFNDLMLRCDDRGRIGSIGRIVYKDKQSTTYFLSGTDLGKFSK